jgi:hypothetical protein
LTLVFLKKDAAKIRVIPELSKFFPEILLFSLIFVPFSFVLYKFCYDEKIGFCIARQEMRGSFFILDKGILQGAQTTSQEREKAIKITLKIHSR